MASSIGSFLNGLVSTQRSAWQRTAASHSKTTSGEWLVEAASGQKLVDLGPNRKMIIDEQPVSVRLRGANCIYSGNAGNGQSAYVEYAAGSTDADPVVRITGTSLSGEYDQTVHIKDIDPRNATYPELCALFGHLERTGQAEQYHIQEFVNNPLPSEIERGDYTQRQDFMQKLQACNAKNARYNPEVAQDCQTLMAVYEQLVADFAQQADSSRMAQADALLDTVGRARVEKMR